MHTPKIAIAFSTPELKLQAEALATKLKLPISAIDSNSYDFLLVYTPDHLEIRPINEANLGSLHIDFMTGKLGYRISHTSLKNELVAKAMGVKGNTSLTIIDATAGLGRDSFILATLGCKVTMLERSPILASLLEDGLQRLMSTKEDGTDISMKLLQINAHEYLEQLNEQHYPDVIYLDPMYPHRTKSALVKKEFRIIRQLVGDDLDAATLFNIALKRAKKRVIVKRPRLATQLTEHKPNYTLEGKQNRFDIYLL